MKIATDFFGVEGLDETFKFNAELRLEGSSSTLPPKTMLWHMWHSLTSLAPADSADPPARAKRKRGKSKIDRLQANKKGKMLEKPFRRTVASIALTWLVKRNAPRFYHRV